MLRQSKRITAMPQEKPAFLVEKLILIQRKIIQYLVFTDIV